MMYRIIFLFNRKGTDIFGDFGVQKSGKIRQFGANLDEFRVQGSFSGCTVVFRLVFLRLIDPKHRQREQNQLYLHYNSDNSSYLVL